MSIKSPGDHKTLVRGHYIKRNGKYVAVKPHYTTVRVHHNKSHK